MGAAIMEAAGPGAYAMAANAVGAAADKRTSLFFITGAPRTGTAFLSQAMMYGRDSFCFHEAERDITDAEDIGEVTSRTMERMLGLRRRYIGNSSSGMIAFGQLTREIPLVIVHRPWKDLERSIEAACKGWGVEPPYSLAVMREMFERFCWENGHALHVKFGQVFSVEGLSKIWRHCCPTIPPPVENFKETVRHRITMRDFNYPWGPGEPWGIKAEKERKKERTFG